MDKKGSKMSSIWLDVETTTEANANATFLFKGNDNTP